MIDNDRRIHVELSVSVATVECDGCHAQAPLRPVEIRHVPAKGFRAETEGARLPLNWGEAVIERQSRDLCSACLAKVRAVLAPT